MSADAVQKMLPSAVSSGACTPKSKLDSLSREDLVRFVKKQLENLGKARKEISMLKDAREKLEYELKQKESQEAEKIDSVRKEHRKENESISEELETLRRKCAQLQSEPKKDKNDENEVSGKEASESAGLKEILEEFEALKGELRQEQTRHRTLQADSSQMSEDLVSELQQVKNMFHTQTEDLLKKEQENKWLKTELDDLQSVYEDAKEKLNAIKETHSAVNVLSLEMADYEKGIESLKRDLKEANRHNEDQEKRMKELHEKFDASEQEREKLNSTNTKLKAAIVKIKKQSEERKESAEKYEKSCAAEGHRHEQMRIEWEQERVRMSKILGEQEEKIRQTDQLISSLQSQISILRGQREALQRQHDDVVMEFDVFKTKARYVLEQQKTAAPTESPAESDYCKKLKAQLESQVDANNSLSERCHLLDVEVSIAREKIFSLNENIETLKKEAREKVAHEKSKQKEQLTSAESRISSLMNQNHHLKMEVNDRVLALREKDRQIQDLHQETALAQQETKRLLGEIEVERRRAVALEGEIQTAKQNSNAVKPKISVKYPRGPQDSDLIKRVNRELLEKPVSSHLDGIWDEDQNFEGEVEDRPLEDVIFGNEEEPHSPYAQFASSENFSFSHLPGSEQLHQQLQHSGELLKETEENNALLVEQIKVLKEEVRRLERNADRASHLANTEYLKNVVMKFLAPEPKEGDDCRPQLIPVLTTMLKLSEKEVEALQRCSRNEESEVESSSSYSLLSGLHRWTGFS
ncbi:hypothetical protein L596_015068 [Steinernema carpocapsae]|uniref:GRIP domain-containing protein n=1 Tax=Steinernema carpocapsae TaxID=34508 RepID=A0A4U5NER5_STECR|nr:hypothetical protein L596_015068 [Steinernema carpocapsae]